MSCHPKLISVNRAIISGGVVLWNESVLTFLGICLTHLSSIAWASYQICYIAFCTCARNAGNIFPATDFRENRWWAIPACITARASRTCRDACWDRYPGVAGKKVPGIPGTYATHNFTYLAWSLCAYVCWTHFENTRTRPKTIKFKRQ